MPQNIYLTGDRLCLREHNSDDFDAFFRWISHPQVTAHLSWGISDKNQAQKRFQEILLDQISPTRQQYFFVIEQINTPGTSIGDCGFTLITAQIADLGYFLFPEYWGNGFAQEASRLYIDFGFQKLGLHRFEATCSSHNTQSVRVLKALGMKADETYSKKYLHHGTWIKRLRFTLTP